MRDALRTMQRPPYSPVVRILNVRAKNNCQKGDCAESAIGDIDGHRLSVLAAVCGVPCKHLQTV